jgi:hypothetical protein
MNYVFVNKEGEFIALDRASGGYPYTVNTIFRAHIWKDRKEAFKYSKHFKDWDLFEITDVILEKITPIEVQETHYE